MNEQPAKDIISPLLRQGFFSGREMDAHLLAEKALAAISAEGAIRILDLGCGTGALAMAIHARRPDCTITGIDLSPANVSAARKNAVATDIDFICADYRIWKSGRFHMIISDSVLHLIEMPIEQLAIRLAAALVPGGLLVATAPDARLINHIHLALRRAWRLLPRCADRLALLIARLAFPAVPQKTLSERIPYLRILPRLFGKEARRAFSAAKLELVRDEEWPVQILGKPHHRLLVWRLVS